MFEDDGYFFRVLGAEVIRNFHLRRAGLEANIDLVTTGNPAGCDLPKRFPGDAAHGVLDHFFVVERGIGHGGDGDLLWHASTPVAGHP